MSQLEDDCLFTQAEIERALDAMAEQINQHFSAIAEPLVVLVIMKGALVTAGALLPRLKPRLLLDYVHASRYRDNKAGVDLHWSHKPSADLTGRTVLLVDDILDEGVTLKAIRDYCLTQGASRVGSAVLVKKRRAQPSLMEADFVALEVPDRFVYGFGMDNNELGRNAPGIYALAD